MKAKLKELKQVLTHEFGVIYDLYSNSKVSDADVDKYIQNFPSIYKVLEQTRSLEEYKKKQEMYQVIVGRTESESKKFLKSLRTDRIIITEAIRQAEAKECVTPKEITTNNNHLDTLSVKLNEIDRVISALTDALKGVKRQRGRPKKSEYEEVLDDEEGEED